jgi:hypothetical protein
LSGADCLGLLRLYLRLSERIMGTVDGAGYRTRRCSADDALLEPEFAKPLLCGRDPVGLLPDIDRRENPHKAMCKLTPVPAPG